MKNHLPFKTIFSVVFFLLFGVFHTAIAQTKFFQTLSPEEGTEKMRSAPTQNINKFIVVELNESSLKSYLSAAPSSKSSSTSGITLDIPMPDGTTETFSLYESSILSEQQQALHPEIKTYKGQGIANPGYKISFTLSPIGFSAIITGVNGDTVIIERVKNVQNNLYRIYFSSDAILPDDMHSGSRCKTPSHHHEDSHNEISSKFTNGSELKTFRLAIAATGEFTIREGSQANAYAKIVQYVSELNAIYETEMGITLTLISGTDLVYTNAATDPYTNSDEGTMIDENITNIDSIIGNSNYDIGHVLGASGSDSGGGVAYFQSVCNDTLKGGGASKIGDEIWYAHIFSTQLVAHELGHQFGMSHSYNSNIPVCTTRAYPLSVEPGSGTTIMSYGFTCSNDNPSEGVTGDDDYHHNEIGGQYIGPFLNFHIKSIEQSLSYLATVDCNTSEASTNNPPVITAMQTSYAIPKSTPFQLQGTATDVDGDLLSYSWEGTNISSMPAIPDPNDPDRMISPPELDGTVLGNTELPPFFRSYPLVSSGSEPGLRYYPLLSAILDGSNYAKGDKLPSIAYVTTHTLSVRDGNGGLATEDVTVDVDDSGPFLITDDPTGSHNGNSSINVTWSVNGTAAAPVSCTLVDIWLSTDGGQTFTISLANAVPNNGAASVTLPNISTTQARIKVMPSTSTASGNIPNIFFDISNSDFAINDLDTIIWTINNEWSNGTGPTATDDVLIEGNLVTNSDLSANNITVASTGSITISEGNSLTLAGQIVNNALATNFIVASGANLIQTVGFTGANIGSVTVYQNSTPMVRNDMTLWSSPVQGQEIKAFSPETLNNRFWNYDESNSIYSVLPNVNVPFEAAMGIAIRVRNTLPTGQSEVVEGKFEGIPFNGTFTVPVTADGEGFNLVGNPYASNIDAQSFLLSNPTVEGLYFWTHEFAVGSANFGNNYAAFSAAGSNLGDIDFISKGQGFFAKTATAGTVEFNNSMRSNDAATFYKGQNDAERNRLWISISNEEAKLGQILVAYMSDATNGFDNQIDAKLLENGSVEFYNMLEQNKYAIQGRALPFDDSDIVPIGFKLAEGGSFNINLEYFDGLFSEGNVTVYLKDKMTNTTHNLSESAYTFESEAGEFNERFEVVYETEEVMGTGDLTSNSVQIYTENDNIIVNSKSEKILSVELFDMVGRNIFRNEKVNSNHYEFKSASKGVLVVRVQTQNGEVITKKLINNY